MTEMLERRAAECIRRDSRISKREKRQRIKRDMETPPSTEGSKERTLSDVGSRKDIPSEESTERFVLTAPFLWSPLPASVR